MLPRNSLDVFRSEPGRRYLRIASVEQKDEAILAAQLAQSELARLRPWAPGEGGTAPLDRWRAYAARVADAGGRVYTVDDIYRRANPVGCVGLIPHPTGAITLETWIAPEVWGKGFTSLLTEGVCDELFVHANAEAIVAECFIDNPAGRRVLEKVGFIETGGSERVRTSLEQSAEVGLFRLSRSDWVRAAVKTTPRLATERLILRPWLLEDCRP